MKDIKSFIKSNKLNKKKRTEFIVLTILMILINITMIHIHIYLMLSSLKDINIEEMDLKNIIPYFLLAASFDLAQYVKGWIVPIINNNFSHKNQLYISFLGVASLCTATILLSKIGILPVIIFILLFRGFLSISQNIIQSSLMINIGESLRATIFSLIQCFVLILYATYSSYLVYFNIQYYENNTIIAQTLILTIITFFICFLYNFD